MDAPMGKSSHRHLERNKAGTNGAELAYNLREGGSVDGDAMLGRVPSPAVTEDERTIRLCQAGHGEAFRPLVERYGDVLFGAAVLMTGDRSLAEELTQEAFISAWRAIGRFRPGAPVKPWLLRILVNKVLSHRRKRFLRLLPLLRDERSARQPDLHLVIEEHEEYEEVRRALAELPDAQRRALALRFYAELSVPEIARATGWPEGTVKSRLHRALQQMRARLEPGLAVTE